MPNYASNRGFVRANNKAGIALVKLWMKDYEKGNEGENERNFCDVFVPQPDWNSVLNDGETLINGSWNVNGTTHRLWAKNKRDENRALTEEESAALLVLAQGDTGIIGSYNFCSNVWGTKWGLYTDESEVEFDDRTNTIHFSGTTAWAPFANMWNNVANDITQLNAELIAEGKEPADIYVEHDYDEGGMDYCGRITLSYEEGELHFHDECFEFDEGVQHYNGEHGTLPDAEDYYEMKRHSTDVLYAGLMTDFTDGDLVFDEDGMPIIMMPSQMQVHWDGMNVEIVKHPYEEDFYVAVP